MVKFALSWTSNPKVAPAAVLPIATAPPIIDSVFGAVTVVIFWSKPIATEPSPVALIFLPIAMEPTPVASTSVPNVIPPFPATVALPIANPPKVAWLPSPKPYAFVVIPSTILEWP